MTGPVAGTNTPVRFSAVFRISAMYSGLTTPRSIVAVPVWDHASSLEVLTKVTNAKRRDRRRWRDLDATTRTITVPLTANANDASTVTQATSTVQTGLASIAAAAAPNTRRRRPVNARRGTRVTNGYVKDNLTINPTNPPPVAPGATCYPATSRRRRRVGG